MEVEFSLTRADLIAFSRIGPLHEKVPVRSRFRTILSQLLWIFLLVLFTLWFWIAPNSLNYLLFLLAGLFAGAMGMLLYLAYVKRSALLSNEGYFADERNRSLFAPQRIRIDPAGLTLTNSRSETRTQWSGICQIDQSECGVVLWTSTRAAHVVPRHAFRDPQHLEEFVALARQYKRAWPEQKPTGILTSLPPESTAIKPQDAL